MIDRSMIAYRYPQSTPVNRDQGKEKKWTISKNYMLSQHAGGLDSGHGNTFARLTKKIQMTKGTELTTSPTPKAMLNDTTRFTIQSLQREEMGLCESFDTSTGQVCQQHAAFSVSLSKGTNKERRMCPRHVWEYGLTFRK